MRDPARITPTLTAVERLWRQCPDMRLGQLLWMIAGRDPFYIEDTQVETQVNIIFSNVGGESRFTEAMARSNPQDVAEKSNVDR